MDGIKEYYPSLATSEYEPETFVMFIHNADKSLEKAIEPKHAKYINLNASSGAGGLGLDKKSNGGLGRDDHKKGKGKGGLGLDTDTVTESATGALGLDNNTAVGAISFDKYKSLAKKYASFIYEAGFIIGVNPGEGRLYVQFADTPADKIHIFATGVSSDGFDVMDKCIQKMGVPVE